MESSKIQKLTLIAQKYMSFSRDSLHDLDHVKRAVKNAKILSRDLDFNEKQEQILLLATWWHDVSRAFFKKPSYVWMTIIDDIMSAFLLWRETVRQKLFGKIVGTTVRVIICKGVNPAGLIAKILLTKKNRIIVDALYDADNLDVIHLDRIKKVYSLVDNAKLNLFGYKVMVYWYLKSKQLYMKTQAARIYVEKLIKKFIDWFKQTYILFWHVKYFGQEWVEANLRRAEQLLQKIRLSNLQPAH